MDDFSDNPLVLLGFLSLFHIAGAVGLAHGLRGVWSGLHDKARGIGRALFLALWGAMFGCLPFAFGLGLATEDGGTPLLFLGQVIIWGSAFLTTLLAWDEILDWLRPFLQPDVFLIAFGGIFMAVGTGAGSLIIRDDLLFGLLFGGIFLLVGGIIFAIGIWSLLKTNR
jgi:hypothetical protein